MRTDLRIVIDTNVVVSAVLFPRSVPRQAFDLAIARGCLLASAATIAELNEVLRRPRLNQYVEESERLEFLAAMVQQAEAVHVTEVLRECRDPRDNKFLELGVTGHASHIISGDRDLLVLNPFRGIAVVSPHDFCELRVK